jgi:DUF177 domain-containing protein
MVSINVAQLLLSAPGAVRQFDFTERLPDPRDELHLRGPITGHARLTRTSRGILVHFDHHARATLECARCLEEAQARIDGSLDEEFLATTDIRTGLPIPLDEPIELDQPLIDEHHEIDLDEVLRQNVLTNMPLQPLCEAVCPGLCAACGQRLDARHQDHQAGAADLAANPFAALAGLIREEDTD